MCDVLWTSLAADERSRRECQFCPCRRIAKKLPRCRGRLRDRGRHLNTSLREARLQRRPETADVIVSIEDRAEEPLPDLLQSRLYASRNLGRWIVVEVQKVLQVPTNVLAILGGEREHKSDLC